MQNIIIIGAGPAGLCAAHELLKHKDYNIIILEANNAIGGISRTIKIKNNRIDIGGHRFFSKNKRVTDWWESLFPIQGRPSKDDKLLNRNKKLSLNNSDPEREDRVMLIRERVSQIYYKHKFFDYPVEFNLSAIINMGFIMTLRAACSFLKAIIYKLPENNLENFYINRFGKVLYSIFFESYTQKLWGRHPREISADWGAQRVKGLSVMSVFKNAFAKFLNIKHEQETSLIEKFLYPKYGPGQLWETVAQEIINLGVKIKKNKKVIRIESKNNKISRVVCNDGTSFQCDILISSMPIKDLVLALDNITKNTKRIANGLAYRDFQTVGVLLPIDKFLLRNHSNKLTVGNITPNCWIYIQDPSVKLGRIQVFNNWSPYMLKDFEHNVWLGLEYFCNEGDKYWNMSDKEYIKFALEELVMLGVIKNTSDVLETHRERVQKAYPAYFDTYQEFDKLRAELDLFKNLYCVGRNGQHRYNNMDHSMLTGFYAADAIINNNFDKSRIWNVNTEKKYHEEN